MYLTDLIRTYYRPVLIFRHRNSGNGLFKHIVYHNSKHFFNMPTYIIMSSGKRFMLRSAVLDTIVDIAEDGKPSYFVRGTFTTPTTETLKAWSNTLSYYGKT